MSSTQKIVIAVLLLVLWSAVFTTGVVLAITQYD